jgi:parallel beta-helix repeat protein
MLLMAGSISFGAAPARGAACAYAPAGGKGLQYLINTTSSDVICFRSGTYSIGAAITLPRPMTLRGVGTDPTVIIDCATRTYCIDGREGPSDVTLQDLTLRGALKADVQIGGASGHTPISGWSMSGLTVRDAGQVGIAINRVSDISITNSRIVRNGSTGYGTSNPTGDFGLRAVGVDGLTVTGSTIANNPTSPDAKPGFAGGLKLNTDTNVEIANNTFAGNTGGGQLWIDIDSHDFHVANNTFTNGGSSRPDSAIRVEVSCDGTTGSLIENNTLEGGDLAGVDLYDANGITLLNNQITVPGRLGVTAGKSYGIRMYGNAHKPVPGPGTCQVMGSYPNADNTASGNHLNLVARGLGLNGVFNTAGGSTSGNGWDGNSYTVRDCTELRWEWWDGSTNQTVNFADWQTLGLDVGAGSGCVSAGAPPATPTITSPAGPFRLAPYNVTWTASAKADGYNVRWRSARYDGGFPSTWTEDTTASTSYALPAPIGETTCFQVGAYNIGATTWSSIRCTALPLDETTLKPSPGWSTVNATDLYQGAALRTKIQGSTLRLTGIETRQIALLIQRRPGGGQVDVLWNGRLLRSISTSALAVRDQVRVPIVRWQHVHAGTITIRVASAGKPVLIDGVGLLRT